MTTPPAGAPRPRWTPVTPATSPAPALEGFEYVRPLGSGGQADVHLYCQRLPHRLVAVKVLRERDPAAAASLVAEANALAAVEHPHIAEVYAVGVAPDGRPYLVMRHDPGATLADRAGAVGVEEALRLGVQLSGAVATLHAAGLLHRDIKPANVLVSAYGTPILADFALAAGPDADEAGASLPWTAPELLLGGEPATEASEVYALAATLWTLLAGRAPYADPSGDDTPAALLRRVRAGRLGALPGDVPDGLARLLRRALDADPSRRPASARAFGAELRALQSDLGLPRTDWLADGGDAPEASPRAHPSGRHPAPWLVGGLTVAIAAGALGVWGLIAPRPAGTSPAGGTAGVPAASAAPPAARPAPDTPSPLTLTGRRTGDLATFAWPRRHSVETYRARVGARVVTVADPTLEVRSHARVCVEVQALRDGVPAGPPARGCA